MAAASALFVDHGYLGTTMAAIADDAGVSVQTLYLAFGSKVAILRAVHDIAIVGDDEQVPLLDRAWVELAQQQPGALGALRVIVDNSTTIVARVSPVHGVIRAAAGDAEVAALLAEFRDQRTIFMHALGAQLRRMPGCNPRLTADQAGDVLYAVLSDDLYRLLVIEREWPFRRWRDFVYLTASTHLLSTAPQDLERSEN